MNGYSFQRLMIHIHEIFQVTATFGKTFQNQRPAVIQIQLCLWH
jgi:hypothetical protein